MQKFRTSLGWMGEKKKKSPNRWKITLNSGRWLQTLGWKCGNGFFFVFFYYTAGRQRRYAALAGLLNFQSWNCLVVGPRAASYLETLRIRSWLMVFVSFFTLLWFWFWEEIVPSKKKKILTSTTKWGKKRAQVHTYCTTDRHRRRAGRGAGVALHWREADTRFPYGSSDLPGRIWLKSFFSD